MEADLDLDVAICISVLIWLLRELFTKDVKNQSYVMEMSIHEHLWHPCKSPELYKAHKNQSPQDSYVDELTFVNLNVIPFDFSRSLLL